jgi:hypothetical protein
MTPRLRFRDHSKDRGKSTREKGKTGCAKIVIKITKEDWNK